ncbi:MAG: hypothetical protein ACTSRG_02695 [Candidatus Helarchaeota archaeon]
MMVAENNEKLIDLSQTVITWLDDLKSRIHIPKDIENSLEDLKTVVKIKSKNYLSNY